MLTIPRTPKSARRGHRDCRVDPPPKFRLSESSSPSRNSPLESQLHPFFASVEKPHSITIGEPTPKAVPVVPMVTMQSIMSTFMNRSVVNSPPECYILERNDLPRGNADLDNTHSTTIIIGSDSSGGSELGKLDSSSDESLVLHSPSCNVEQHQNPVFTVNLDQSDSSETDRKELYPIDVPPRPNSEPLFAKTPAAKFRPASAEPADQRKVRIKQKRDHIKKSTICQTPHCARPTKSWLARFETKPEELPAPRAPRPRSKLSDEQGPQVWERLYALGAAGHHSGNK